MRAATALAVAAAIAVAAPAAASPAAPSRCAPGALELRVATQGASQMAVGSVLVEDRGGACRLDARASVAIVRHGVRVGSIHGNPLGYRVVQTLAHGTTLLFDAWWSDWCGSRGALRYRATLAALTASAAAAYVPVCLDARAPSRLTGVREYPPAGPVGP